MASVTSVCYFKRFKMEVDLNGLPAPELPAGFRFVGWHGAMIEPHAEVLYASFHQEIDSIVFPSLGDRNGCTCLITEISRRWGFVPGATWLLEGPAGPCGTVQGVRERSGLGAIQNVGIAPPYRGRGLGQALVLQALHGFYAAGFGRAQLEVTAQNDGAIRLYRRLGFHCRKTLYKAVPDPRASCTL